MICYKLTDQNGQTSINQIQWGPGIRRNPRDEDDFAFFIERAICAYRDPLVAMLLDPAHENFGHNVKIWKSFGHGEPLDDGVRLKFEDGLTTLHAIPVERPTIAQRVAFGILAAREIYSDPEWRGWSENWLSHHTTNFTLGAAITVLGMGTAGDVSAATAAAEAKKAAAAMAATNWTVEMAAMAGRMATNWTAEAAEAAAWAAVRAAEAWRARTRGSLDLTALARQAMRIK